MHRIYYKYSALINFFVLTVYYSVLYKEAVLTLVGLLRVSVGTQEVVCTLAVGIPARRAGQKRSWAEQKCLTTF